MVRRVTEMISIRVRGFSCQPLLVITRDLRTLHNDESLSMAQVYGTWSFSYFYSFNDLFALHIHPDSLVLENSWGGQYPSTDATVARYGTRILKIAKFYAASHRSDLNHL